MEHSEDMFVSTEDRILCAAIDLMEQKGFKAVTTKEIAAESGFSEMTLFRHFGTKKKLLEIAVERYSYIKDMKEILLTNVTYDLERDLQMVSETYHKYMEENQKIVLLAFQERNTIPNIGEKTATNPRILKEYLIDYMKEMQVRKKVVNGDPEIIVMNFLWLNLGFFIAKFIVGNNVAQIKKEDFIRESVKIFVRGIQRVK
ncbi:AcrR family transcriptional regulator [Evansella vedderi]|uniref:AcrR family transcriptional regulator n=1 Tax=Evansella vedderi TaxID=38282 RepID=A0ABU0A2H6_9BACI|nr:TetR/AcrR family transcriptional regulator [Evansella vedderi]MDQ0256555.1 AcrR family transcriptional regulator [Evansella vedderi]